jgi:hypothetical protein
MRLIILSLLTLVFALRAAAPVTTSVSCPNSGNVALVSKSTSVATYTVQAPITNSGLVYIGNQSVTTSNGAPYLTAGAAYTEPPQGNMARWDLYTIHIACTVNTDTVRLKY